MWHCLTGISLLLKLYIDQYLCFYYAKDTLQTFRVIFEIEISVFIAEDTWGYNCHFIQYPATSRYRIQNVLSEQLRDTP